MATVEAVLALIAACIGFALIARRLRLPYAVVLMLGGMGLAFVPGLPHLTLNPEFALAFFLPPLLQASALRTDWHEFRAALRPILLLAVGAVAFTTLCVAGVMHWLLPDFPLAAAIALGAILAPPDAVSAGAVLGRLRVPRRLLAVLEGESLVNDATSLVLFRFATAAALAGTVSWARAGPVFVLVSVGGLAVGWAVGRATLWALVRLRDTALETALSFLVCFVAYALAEALGASGVIAVVTSGGIVSRGRYSRLGARSRLDALPVWEFTEFLLTSLVFVLVGLQLRDVLAGLAGHDPWQVAWIAAAVSATLVVSRFVWVFGTAYAPLLLPARLREAPPRPAVVAVVGWAGMRGVVSLAAALAVPEAVPERALIVFLAFCAIFVTLVLQGTTLEWWVRRLGVEVPARTGMSPAEAEARRVVNRAALHEVERRMADPLEGAIAGDLVEGYRDLARLFDGVATGAREAELTARLRIRLAALRAGRDGLLAHHESNTLPETIVARLVNEMDHEEARLSRLLRDRAWS